MPKNKRNTDDFLDNVFYDEIPTEILDFERGDLMSEKDFDMYSKLAIYEPDSLPKGTLQRWNNTAEYGTAEEWDIAYKNEQCQTQQQQFAWNRRNKEDFPLAQWFDITKKISKLDADTCSAQMALYALKDGLDPNGKQWQDADRQMRLAVRKHNKPYNEREQINLKLVSLNTRLKLLTGKKKPKSSSHLRTIENAKNNLSQAILDTQNEINEFRDKLSAISTNGVA